MGCTTSSLPNMSNPMDAIKDTISGVMSGNQAPEMLDSVLSSANINMPVDMDDLGSVCPIVIAASLGNAAVMKAVLHLKPDMTSTDGDGNTALHIAVKKEKIEVVEELIKAGADVNTPNKEGVPPISTAIKENENNDIVEKLLESKANVNPSTGDHPLSIAASGGKVEVVEMLLAAGADSSGVMVEEGQDLLTWAKENNHNKITSLLALKEPSALPDPPKEEPANDKEEPANDKEEPANDKEEPSNDKEEKGEPDGKENDEDATREGGDGEEQPPSNEEGSAGKADDNVQEAEEPSAANE